MSFDWKPVGVVAGGAAVVAGLAYLARSLEESESLSEDDEGFGEGGRMGYIKRDLGDYMAEAREGLRHPFRSYGRSVKRGAMPYADRTEEEKAELLQTASTEGKEAALLELARQQASRKRVHLANVVPVPNPIHWALGPKREITKSDVLETKEILESPDMKAKVAEKGSSLFQTKLDALKKYFGRS